MAIAGAGTAASKLTPGELLARALGNDDVSYVATRTSIFWSDNGQTRALIARVFKDGDRIRYEYPARGNRGESVVIETGDALYFIRPTPKGTQVTTARRERDPDIEGVRVKLALSNYEWRFEATNSPRRRIVSAWRPGAKHPSQRFWIAIAPMVIVRSERYTVNGALHSSWSLDSMRVVKGLPDRLFTPPHGPDLTVKDAVMPQQVKLEQVRSQVGFDPVTLPAEQVPEGYRLVDTCIEQTVPPSSRKAVRFVYSDGLDSFSLLEAKRVPDATEKLRAAQAKDVHILDTTAQVFTSPEANLIHWQDKKRLYTLMGALPPRQLVEMSRAIIAASAPPRPALTSAPTAAIQPPHRRSFSEIIARGWSRLLRLFGW
jgi:hypothetical protein